MCLAGEDDQLATDDPPRARLVIDRLLDRVEQRSTIPREVAASLDSARRACGDDGAFDLTTAPAGRAERTVHFDHDVIKTLAAPAAEPATSTSISGRLTRLEESPDRASIRAPDGTVWTAVYPPELAEDLQPLWRRNVYSTGHGEKTSPRKGTFELTSISPLLDDAQTELFTFEHIDTDILLANQGIREPQGLDGVAPADLLDDQTEDAYLAAIFSDDA